MDAEIAIVLMLLGRFCIRDLYWDVVLALYDHWVWRHLMHVIYLTEQGSVHTTTVYSSD